MSVGCNVIPRNDGYNVALKMNPQCCGQPAVEVGIWHNDNRGVNTFVYPCERHASDFGLLPFDGVHKHWYERVARIIR
jgi:hypothetical protein